MKNYLVAIACFLFIISIPGCSQRSENDCKIQYGFKKYEKKFGNCDSVKAGCATVLLEYPEIKHAFNDAIKDSLTKFIQDMLLDNYFHEQRTKSLDEMTKLYFEDYKNTQTDFIEYNLPWEINNTISINYNAQCIVSFQSEFYHFTGGAHGMTGVYFANFNSQNGKRLMLSDLLISGFEKQLDNIAEKIFRKVRELKPEDKLEEAGFWFEGNRFALNENFGIKNDGLIFYFNSYEIAPYSMGPTEILIPYAEIRNLVKQDGLLNEVIEELE
jgi:Protein of unknown function (DUF3298)/Deacetylase PdaC